MRSILHVDMNNFYASVEGLYHPEIRNFPVAVAGDPLNRHGIILAKNMIAKKLGVTTGEAIWEAKLKAPGLVLVPPDYKKYIRFSRMAREIYYEYSDQVEAFGLDENWIDLTGSLSCLHSDPATIADTIRRRVKEELGVTVSVGVSFNKIFAKLGSDLKKPDATTVIPFEHFKEIVWPLPVGDLLFVGGASANRLREEHIYTIGELAHADPELLRRILGDKMSLQARNYANGINNSPVRAEPEEAKGYSNSVTLEENVTTLEAADAIHLALSDSVSAHMRSDGAKAYCVAVSIRYLDFKNRSHQCKTDQPMESTREIYELSKRLLRELWKDHRPLRLMSIALSNLTREDEGGQMSLFGEEDSGRRERDVKLDKAVDALRSKFGADIIQRGTVMKDGLQVARKFRGKQESERDKT